VLLEERIKQALQIFCFAICFETLEVERVEFRADNNNTKYCGDKKTAK
jgi:hypothetical protein